MPLPVLIGTAGVTRATRDSALKAGVDDFLAKPIDPDELGIEAEALQRRP